MSDIYTRTSVIPDALLTPFAGDPQRCEGLGIKHFDDHPPELLPIEDVGYKWSLISQKPVAPHTIAQLRWIVCDTSDRLFRRAELENNYYIRRDEAALQHLGLVLGQVTNAMHASGDRNAGTVESLQNRIKDVAKVMRESGDIRDWSWGKITLTGAAWAGGVVGSFVFLSAAFGIGVHKAPQIYEAVRKIFDKNDKDPKPPAVGGGSSGAGVPTSAPSGSVSRVTIPQTVWRGWDPSAKGYADDDGVGTILLGAAVFLAWEVLPALGEWELPELLVPELAPAF